MKYSATKGNWIKKKKKKSKNLSFCVTFLLHNANSSDQLPRCHDIAEYRCAVAASRGGAAGGSAPPLAPLSEGKKWPKPAIFDKFLDFCPLRIAICPFDAPHTKISGVPPAAVATASWEAMWQGDGMADHPYYAKKIFPTEKVYFKSQILVHEYWTILDHFGVPVLFASGCN